MVDIAELASRLQQTPPKIDRWREQAAQLHGLLDVARAGGAASPSLLQSIETTAGEIYAEISSYDGLVQDVAAVSPAAAAELAEVNDALHLVLMEITELSTALYAVRSP